MMLAKTLPKAIERGDVKTHGAGGSYELLQGKSESRINGRTVNGWRKLAAIPLKDRQRYYAENSRSD